MTGSIPRGERLFNPGNIRINDQRFQGEVQPSSDAEFKQFESPVMGIRAMGRLLITYYTKYGLNTCQTIANRWAPPSENDTSTYAASLAKQMGLGVDEAFKVNDPAKMTLLLTAITRNEQGSTIWPQAFFQLGARMALGVSIEGNNDTNQCLV